MNHPVSATLVATLALALSAPAQDMVTLQSVTIDVNDQVTVVYSKNFATCAHLRLSDSSCSQLGPLVHTQNHFCAQGTTVAVTVPRTAFSATFVPGAYVKMVHGNNSNVQSACATVECDGSYGVGCAGAAGVPVLTAVDGCPPAGGVSDLRLDNAAAGSVAILGLGVGPGSIPLFGCTILLGAVGATQIVLIDPVGRGAATLSLPPTTSGLSFNAQAYVLDAGGPQGFAATNGYLIRIR